MVISVLLIHPLRSAFKGEGLSLSQLEVHLCLERTQHMASSPRHTMASWRIVQSVKSVYSLRLTETM